MAEEETYADPYAQPSERLKEEVVKAVLTRLADEKIRGALEVAGDGHYNVDRVEEIAMFGLSTQQPVTVDGLHALEKPSNWGFLVYLTDENGDAIEPVFAEAGPSADGTDYRYSTIVNVPEAVKRKEMLERIERSDDDRDAFLQIPAYQLFAFWRRTADPKGDQLYLKEPTYGRFQEPRLYLTLEDFVHYMNDSLAAGAPLLKEKDRGDYIDSSEKEPDTKK